MNASEIKAELSNRNALGAVLWVNHDRKEAAFHPGGGETYCTPLAYAEARKALASNNVKLYARGDGHIFTAC